MFCQNLNKGEEKGKNKRKRGQKRKPRRVFFFAYVRLSYQNHRPQARKPRQATTPVKISTITR